VGDFKDDDEDFFGDDATDGTATEGGGGVSLDLTEADLSDGIFKAIPLGTWIKLKIYEVTPGMVKSGNNYGKPKYQITFISQDDCEWGAKRKFTEFANLYGKAFFVAFPILRSIGMAPTKEMLAPGKGAFFASTYADEFPAEMGDLITDVKRIPNGAYVFPAPSAMQGQFLYAKITGYRGNQSGFKEYKSEANAIADPTENNTRAFPKFGEYKSVEDFEAMQADQSESVSVFKGDKD
jgi:hypothetical protein